MEHPPTPFARGIPCFFVILNASEDELLRACPKNLGNIQ